MCAANDVLEFVLLCDAEFEQTEDGFAVLKLHEFEHGMGTLFDWSEINGKQLRLVVVSYDTDLKLLYSGEADLYGIDDEAGIVYLLNHQYVESWWSGPGGWKWKIGTPKKRGCGQKLMPPVQGLRLFSSRNTGER